MRKAQAWYMDLSIGLVIFSIAFVVYFRALGNIADTQPAVLDELSYDTNIIADSLTSKGFPDDWNVDTVERIGLITNDRLDNEKIRQFQNITLQRGKTLFGTRFDYGMFFTDANRSVLFIESCTLGSPVLQSANTTPGYCSNISIDGVQTNHLVSAERVVIYRGRFTNMVVYAWE